MINVNLIRIPIVFVGISGCFSVLFGAWLAHGGQALTEEIQFRLVNALQYQFIHTLALLVVLVWYMHQPSKWLMASGSCFFIGILCFSGSLYVKTFLNISIVGKLAPLGGMLLALGWLLTIFIGKNLLSKQLLVKK